jgi:hypothetical protein
MLILSLVTVLLAPWHGAALPTTPTGEYVTSWALTVRGAPHQRVSLSAEGVAKGWVASFCTSRLCAPFRAITTLDARGIARYEFSLIQVDPKGPPGSLVTIRVNGRSVAKVGVASDGSH